MLYFPVSLSYKHDFTTYFSLLQDVNLFLMVKVSKENLDFNTLLSVNIYKDAITLFFGGYFRKELRRFISWWVEET